MNTLFSTLSASEAQELRGGLYEIIIVEPVPVSPSNGTGSNAGGNRNPASEAGYSEEKGRIPAYTGNGNHWGWADYAG